MILPLSTRRTPHAQDLAHFSRQLAECLGEQPAQPLRALHLTGQFSVHPQLRQLTTDLTQDVGRGLLLQHALAQTKHTPLLGQLFGTCVRQSESTDQLVRSLHDLATYYDREAHLTHTVQRRLSLPLVVLGISLLTCVLIPLVVLPTASSLLP